MTCLQQRRFAARQTRKSFTERRRLHRERLIIRNVCRIRQLRLIRHLRPIRKLFVTGKVSQQFLPILISVGPYLVLGL